MSKYRGKGVAQDSGIMREVEEITRKAYGYLAFKVVCSKFRNFGKNPAIAAPFKVPSESRDRVSNLITEGFKIDRIVETINSGDNPDPPAIIVESIDLVKVRVKAGSFPLDSWWHWSDLVGRSSLNQQLSIIFDKVFVSNLVRTILQFRDYRGFIVRAYKTFIFAAHFNFITHPKHLIVTQRIQL
ncbi:hypothetical protein CCACVL1_02450 [Corchorus capsularis]|uniref:Uncharacterized protein n=1 Tax=Corchorus capsularis TaxID=210143 RepID=A0A1R3K8F0_COCAP|nr:hypothetical protein CCACVL1_02450 [Corchorus capsularis]